MGTSSIFMDTPELTHEESTQGITHPEILEQLDRITRSAHFRNSRRYPVLLRYIVETALAGDADSLKERILGLYVFDRPADYDTNQDPVVRVTAGEVRKRIAQYYQSPGHEQELRIEIPLGSYVPLFSLPAFQSSKNAAPEDDPTPSAITLAHMVLEDPQPIAPKRKPVLHLAVLYMLFAVTLATLGFVLWKSSHKPALPPGVALFWEQILHSPTPTLLVLGVHSFDANGNDISAQSHASLPQTSQTLLSAMTRSDMVHLSDVTSYGALTQLLAGHGHAFRTQGAADTTLEQLRQGPFVLIGGFNNVWTKRLTEHLRFRFVTLPGGINVIQDSQHPQTVWTLDASVSALSNTQDYGLISCFLDPGTDQYVVMAGGIGKSATEAAAGFLTNEKELNEWLRRVPDRSGSNVQVVVSTEVIEGKHGPPHVVAYYFW